MITVQPLYKLLQSSCVYTVWAKPLAIATLTLLAEVSNMCLDQGNAVRTVPLQCY